MKNKLTFALAGITLLLLTSCLGDFDAPTVQPPSWKGFNYVVRKNVAGGETEQEERGAIQPGNSIRVYAVRKSAGKNIGKIDGAIYIRTTLTPKTGNVVVKNLDALVTTLPNAAMDGWENPYASFDLPKYEGEYLRYKVEVACNFYFRANGTEDSEVDYGDRTSHEEPYIGNIYTNYTTFSPLNGGDASTSQGGNGIVYQTLYETR